mmetsp:Transcript_25051/g.54001  ORF Transcript_25051/g.54001 Transcript_25051/m.54001 type:complete len:362 (+) Transcript_25051:83-1168(+)|eukprot:CAMPEP_0172321140 /NCGR_PEP_ID=MMETSP1058-20130122/42452_1 /TAXON_ID=83371 /ORGANISM="Detonula confervacea, Strain CCMP 353" /LENGTH=361 /DNA_ID=CAMNT_0013036569 /DNA_START=33 /DNA_END=1118 /DNA_ORIENTATION=-
MTNQSSSDNKKKKPALPSLLSNIRNAQAVIGRAADDLHDRETRPLVGGGGGGGRLAASSNRPQLQRNVPSSYFSTNIQNFSQRFGDQWRKRGRRKIGHGVTGVPQSFFVAVGCFFFAFPLVFLLFILARHAVFGDEGDISQAHKHEVPTSLGTSFESGKELVEMNVIGINDPEDEIKGVGYIIGVNQTSVNGEVIIDSKMMNGGDPPEVLIESATSGLHDETDQTIGDTLGQIESRKDPITEANTDGHMTKHSIKTMHNVTGEGDGNILAQKEIKSSHDLKETEKDNPEEAATSTTSDLLSTSMRKENVKTYSSSDHVKEKGDVKMEKELSRSNLRKKHVKTNTSSDQVRERVDTKMEKED